jgi:hypothetical protein
VLSVIVLEGRRYEPDRPVHSALGVTRGISDAADRLRNAGHDVQIVDQYGGRTFDDYDEAGAYVDDIGFPAMTVLAAAQAQLAEATHVTVVAETCG